MSEAVDLFLELAALPTPSGEEQAAADVVLRYLGGLGLEADEDAFGNVYARVEPTAEGTPLFSVFSVVHNPSDRWPIVACGIIFVGLLLHFDAKPPLGVGVRGADHCAVQAGQGDGGGAAGQADAVGNLGHGADLRVLLLVPRHQENAILVAGVHRQRDGHAREHHGVLERDEQKVAHNQFTLHSCTRYRNCT